MAELKSVVIQALVSQKAELQKLLQDKRPHNFLKMLKAHCCKVLDRLSLKPERQLRVSRSNFQPLHA